MKKSINFENRSLNCIRYWKRVYSNWKIYSLESSFLSFKSSGGSTFKSNKDGRLLEESILEWTKLSNFLDGDRNQLGSLSWLRLYDELDDQDFSKDESWLSNLWFPFESWDSLGTGRSIGGIPTYWYTMSSTFGTKTVLMRGFTSWSTILEIPGSTKVHLLAVGKE